MKYTLITLIGIITANEAKEALICRLAEVSLYNTRTQKTAKMRSKSTYTIEDHRVYLLVNGKIYNSYNISQSGVHSYLRGKLMILKDSDGRFYIRRVDKKYTGRLICD